MTCSLAIFADFRRSVITPFRWLAYMMVIRIVVGLNRRLQVLDVYASIPLNRKIGHFKASALQVLAGIQHGLVLDGRVMM